MYEVWYWCWQTNHWRRLEGPDYEDLLSAVRAATDATRVSGRAAQVRDLYTGEVLHQEAGTYQPVAVANPAAYW
jgi:hypothetical protein